MRINILVFMRVKTKEEAFEFLDCGYSEADKKCFAVLVQGPTMLRFDVIEAEAGHEDIFDARLRSILLYGNDQRDKAFKDISSLSSSSASSIPEGPAPSSTFDGLKAEAVDLGTHVLCVDNV